MTAPRRGSDRRVVVAIYWLLAQGSARDRRPPITAMRRPRTAPWHQHRAGLRPSLAAAPVRSSGTSRAQPLTVLLLTRYAPGLRTGLRGGAARRRDAEHPHGLQAEAELLAPIGRGDVEPAEVAHALEPVADRMPVREQARGGLGDV